MQAGLNAFGENYVQEALPKIAAIDQSVSWHFIGRVQSNKTRAIAENFSWVQTLASERIAVRLSDQRPAEMSDLQVCIQVNIDNSDHGGVAPGEVADLAAAIDALPRLRLRGVMTIPTPGNGPAEHQAKFSLTRQLFEDLNKAGYDLDTLSMGMSADLESAVHEGSTMLRIGTALFGPREQ